MATPQHRSQSGSNWTAIAIGALVLPIVGMLIAVGGTVATIGLLAAMIVLLVVAGMSLGRQGGGDRTPRGSA